MSTISGFIIAKNEEAKVEKALKSLASFCDEIIFVDTGSTDQTKQITAKYTDKIYDFKWIDDFSAARNFALSKCTKDWIIYLDADDEIPQEAGIKIKKLLNSKANLSESKKDINGLFVTYKYSYQKDLLTPRIFKRSANLKFKMPVHEVLDIPDKFLKTFQLRPEIVIIHHKEATENASTLERNIQLLQKALQKNPQDPHLQFFLGREYFSTQKYEEAINIFKQLLQIDQSQSEHSFKYNVLLHLGFCSEKLNDFTSALNYFSRAYQSEPKFAEPLIYQANIYLYQLRDPTNAQKLYEQALQTPKPVTTFPLNPDFYHSFPKLQLQKLAQLKKPIALICGYYGQLNIGDELMLAALLQNLQQYRPIVASYSPQLTQALHQVESVPHHHAYFDQALKLAKKVIIGGGTLFHDQGLTENKNVEHYCGIIKQGHALKKEVNLIGIGVDEIKLKTNKKLITETFPFCQNIYARDEVSKQRLIQYGIPAKKIKTMPDLIFDFDVQKFLSNQHFTLSEANNGHPLIGINLCPLIIGSKNNVLKDIDDLLLPFIKENKTKYNFIFIPGKQDDLNLLNYLNQKLDFKIDAFIPEIGNDPFKATSTKYFSDYFSIINKCDYLIASRYHLLLIGAMLKKQVFAISYADKTDTLLSDFPKQIKKFKSGTRHNYTPVPLPLKLYKKQFQEIFSKI